MYFITTHLYMYSAKPTLDHIKGLKYIYNVAKKIMIRGRVINQGGKTKRQRS